MVIQLSFNSHTVVIHSYTIVKREHTIEWPLFDHCLTIVQCSIYFCFFIVLCSLFIVHCSPHPQPLSNWRGEWAFNRLFVVFIFLQFISMNFYVFLFFIVHCLLFFTKYELYECTNKILFTVQKSFEFIVSGLWSYSCHSIVIQLSFIVIQLLNVSIQLSDHCLTIVWPLLILFYVLLLIFTFRNLCMKEFLSDYENRYP